MKNKEIVYIIRIACLVLSGVSFYSFAEYLESGDEATISSYSINNENKMKSPGVLLQKSLVKNKYQITTAEKVYKVLYSSKDGINDSIRVNSGIIFIPKGTPPKNGWPIISWQHGTTGTADQCAPSWTGPDQPSKIVISGWLKKGYAVLAADYQGLGSTGIHPYLESKSLAYSVLDLLNASLNAKLNLQNDIFLHGWSEGGFATVATIFYAERYAPTLNIIGASGSGTPYFKKEALGLLLTEKHVPDSVAGYMTYIMNSSSQLKNSIHRDDVFSDEGKEFSQEYGRYCIDDIARVAYENKTDFKKIIKPAALKNPNILNYLSYPSLKVNIPLYLSIGGNDTDAPKNMQLELKRDMCDKGSPVHYKVYPGADHTQALLESAHDTVTFLNNLKGKVTMDSTTFSGCKN
ncbi:lipase family protein [Serratia nevei]|uniref:lipase family protein n=1 Tax=Serratia nevei TaxID=2703794 RepID=UPI003FA6DB1E